MKILNPSMDIMRHHGPMFVIGSVLIVPASRCSPSACLASSRSATTTPANIPLSYTVDRLVRLVPADEQSLMSESKGDNF